LRSRPFTSLLIAPGSGAYVQARAKGRQTARAVDSPGPFAHGTNNDSRCCPRRRRAPSGDLARRRLRPQRRLAVGAPAARLANHVHMLRGSIAPGAFAIGRTSIFRSTGLPLQPEFRPSASSTGACWRKLHDRRSYRAQITRPKPIPNVNAAGSVTILGELVADLTIDCPRGDVRAVADRVSRLPAESNNTRGNPPGPKCAVDV
jgi:hypothetical protein